jgi:ADP-ribose pyrophosphatase YjhB (NUDIX family)
MLLQCGGENPYNISMPYNKHAYCSYCGAAFPAGAPWPRTCSNCQQTSFLNPLPVSVVLLPVEQGDGSLGLLAVRRAIPPRVGELALPGGYINFNESWQEAGSREVFEETGIFVDPAEIREYRVCSAPDGTLIIFGMASPRAAATLPLFFANEEASERLILTAPAAMAFGLHSDMVKLFFDGRVRPVTDRLNLAR